jgi:hypothetical protein
MLIAIGSNIENAPAAQDALREIAGKKRGSGSLLPSNGNTGGKTGSLLP